MLETSELEAYLFIDTEDDTKIILSTPEMFPAYVRLPAESVRCDTRPITPWSDTVQQPTSTQLVDVPTWRLRNRQLRRPSLTFRPRARRSADSTYAPTQLTPAALSILLFCCRRFPESVIQYSRLPEWILGLPKELFVQLRLFRLIEAADVPRFRRRRLQDHADFFFCVAVYARDFVAGRVDIPAGIYVDERQHVVGEDCRRLNVLDVVLQLDATTDTNTTPEKGSSSESKIRGAAKTRRARSVSPIPNLWKSRHLSSELKQVYAAARVDQLAVDEHNANKAFDP